MDVGTSLRAAREQRGLTLDTISRATKIARPILAAIEANDFGRVPGGIFARGFLRAYAAEVGLDAAAVVRAYEEQVAPPAPASAPSEPRDGATSTRVAQAVEDSTSRLHGWRGRGLPIEWHDLRPALVASAMVVVLGGMTYLAVREIASTPTPQAPLTELSTENERIEGEPGALGTAGDNVDPVASSGEGLRIALRARGPCWVLASADGVRAIYRLMQAGEQEVVTATNDVMLRIGDPAQLEWMIDGVPARPLGPAARPVTIHITPANRDQFLPR